MVQESGVGGAGVGWAAWVPGRERPGTAQQEEGWAAGEPEGALSTLAVTYEDNLHHTCAQSHRSCRELSAAAEKG